jgi:hypothetical protein
MFGGHLPCGVTAHGSPGGPLQFDCLEAALAAGLQRHSRGEISKVAKLTAAKRKKLPKSDFVERAARKYPVPDAAHARDALARSSGQPEHAAVVAAVRRKFPKIKIAKKK